MQQAEMGVLAFPYILIQIDKLKKKEASLKGQITRERNRLLRYSLAEYNESPAAPPIDINIGVIALIAIVGAFVIWLFIPSGIAEHTRVSDRIPPGGVQLIANLKPAIVVTPSKIGVRYRTAPNDSAVDVANPTGPQEGETVYLIERTDQADGAWWKVQLQDGRIGYIREQFLSLQP